MPAALTSGSGAPQRTRSTKSTTVRLDATAPHGEALRRGRPLAIGSGARTDQDAALAAAYTHPRYDQWRAEWQALVHVYEGDGPLRTGEALIPHPRELVYATFADGTTDFATTLGPQRKFLQRQRLARYENFASVIVDTLVDHQFGKPASRVIQPRGLLGFHPLERFWEDVDGYGTTMDDWLAQVQTVAHVLGHVFIVMDRQIVTDTAERQARTLTRASAQSRPVLRYYTPLDALDWRTTGHQLTAIKFRQQAERGHLLQGAPTTETEYLLYDHATWTRVDTSGAVLHTGEHGFGRLPVIPYYARRRPTIPVIGRSTLRASSLYLDHYNLLSELREIFRAQTFSMLNIVLGENETVETARGKLGSHAGTDAIVFTSKAAQFIAPPDGPAKLYAEEIHTLETKIFRLVGIPYEQDNRQGVSADTARIKAMDLNRALTGFAERAETLDYQIAELWAASAYGAGRALDTLLDDDLVIRHPAEFYTEQLAEVVQDATATIAVGVGPTATALIKQRVVAVALRDASREQMTQVHQDIADRAAYDAEEAELIAAAARRAGRPDPSLSADPDTTTDGKGTDPNNTDGSGGRSTDPRASAPQAAAAYHGDRQSPASTRAKSGVRTIDQLRRRNRPERSSA